MTDQQFSIILGTIWTVGIMAADNIIMASICFFMALVCFLKPLIVRGIEKWLYGH